MAILSKLVIGVIGTLPHEPQQIKKWIEANGGKWAVGFKKGTHLTHLIASKDAWRKAGDEIQKAHDKGIWIISYDWLEDSLQGKRKLSEKKYTWEYLRKEKKKQKQLKRLGREIDGTSIKLPRTRKSKKSSAFFFKAERVPDTPFQSAAEALKQKRAEREAASGETTGSVQAPIEIEDEAEAVDANTSVASPSSAISMPTASPASNPTDITSSSPSPKSTTIIVPEAKTPHIKDLYHYYLDATGFEYKIMLARSDLSTNTFARYRIGLLESHTKPHTYCTVIQYTPPIKSVSEPTPAPGPPRPGLRNPLLDFLRKNAHPVVQRPGSVTQANEPSRLTSLITPPTPVALHPFKTLLCPLNSPYALAYRTFRHAFRDLTLLTWEERFDANKTVQKSRARALNIEPYLYAKPALGLPTGLQPQETGYLTVPVNELSVLGDVEDEYLRDRWELPGLDVPLSGNGVVGAAVLRDEEEARKKREEEDRVRAEEEEKERRARGEVEKMERKKRVRYNMPMFNGVQGTPGVECGGYGGGVERGSMYGRDLWPEQREWH